MLSKTENSFCGTMLSLATILAFTVVDIILRNLITPDTSIMLVSYIILAVGTLWVFGKNAKATALYYTCAVLVVISYAILYFTSAGRI